MQFKRKYAVIIGVLAMIALGLWLRELASWRPVTVGKVKFVPTKLRFSKDGKFLLAKSYDPDKGTVFILENSTFDSRPETVRGFYQSFPRVRFQPVEPNLIFAPSRSQRIPLAGVGRRSGFEYLYYGGKHVAVAWSKARGEVYGESYGEIWIWDWKNGKLKKRVRYAKSGNESVFLSHEVFSPDGSLLMTRKDKVVNSTQKSYLRLYNVLNGKLIPSPNFGEYQMTSNEFREFGFSPDSQTFWAVSSPNGSPNFVAIRIKTGEIVFNGDATGPVKWLPDGRIGIVTKNGFEWRDFKGNLLARLPGPFQKPLRQNAPESLTDWALSPDGKWIYSCERSGAIHRWRAK